MHLQKAGYVANSTTETEGISELQEWQWCVWARKNTSVHALHESD